MRTIISTLTLTAAILSAGSAFAQSANRSVPSTPRPQSATATVAESKETHSCRMHCDSLAASAKSVSSTAQTDARQTACARKMVTAQ